MHPSNRIITGSSKLRSRSFMAQPFKHPTTGVYYIRRRVPEGLQATLGREYKRSLQTRDPIEAKARFAAEWCKSEEAFSLARAQLSGTSLLNARDIQQLAARWFRSELQQVEQTGDFKVFLLQGTSTSYETPHGAIEHQPWESLRFATEEGFDLDPRETALPYVLRTLKAENIPTPAADSRSLKDLCDAFWSHLLHLSDIAKLRDSGDWITQPKVLDAEPLSIARAPTKGKTLLELFQAYSEAKRLDDGDSRSTNKTLSEFGSTVRRFIELFGNLPLNKIDRGTIQDYRAKLARFPTKAKGAGSLTAPELIAKAEAEQLPTLSPATIHNKLSAISAVLGHAVRMDWIKENPIEASGIAKAAGRAASTKGARRRKDYSAKELLKIFSSPAFTQDGWRLPRSDFGQAFYWLPLLMYYTGARREELAQLAARDVLTDEAGVACLSILAAQDEADAGRTVKNQGSRRMVPLHDDLITLGFLDYSGSQAANGQLFPMLKPNPDGYYSVNWGKAWANYLRKTVNLDSPASPAHGFRHTFKTLCRQAGIPEDIHDAITGHSDGSVSREYGCMPLSRIAEELRKLPPVPAIL